MGSPLPALCHNKYWKEHSREICLWSVGFGVLGDDDDTADWTMMVMLMIYLWWWWSRVQWSQLQALIIFKGEVALPSLPRRDHSSTALGAGWLQWYVFRLFIAHSCFAHLWPHFFSRTSKKMTSKLHLGLGTRKEETQFLPSLGRPIPI